MIRRVITSICVIAVLTIAPAFADDPFLFKDTKKEYKQTLKQLKSEGWSAWDNSTNLEEAVRQYYMSRERSGQSLMLMKVCGIGGTMNAAMRRAENNASTQYTRLQNGQVDGSTIIQITNEYADGKTSTSTTLNSSFRSHSTENVRLPAPSLTLIRTIENGRFEVLLLYIIQS